MVELHPDYSKQPDYSGFFRYPEARISALAAELGRLDPSMPLLGSEAPAELERLSRDYSDYSPVLVERLRGCRAQLVASASSLEQVRLVAGACARHGIALTVRGAGTGNYGQCVPLQGGLVLDLCGLDRLRHFDAATGVIEVEAGSLMGGLNQQLEPLGRALRLVPSTARSATIGGFIAGGSGGIGSLRWGFLRDPGNLLGLEVVTVEPEPRLLRLDAAASTPLNHAYGTNGIITEGEVRRLGESSGWGTVVLAWDSVTQGARHIDDGDNVTFHEFAHQLDREDGTTDGAPALASGAAYRTWSRVFHANYADFLQSTEEGRKTVLDAYGATNPAEFFAVATETFFEKPQQLYAERPDMYAELMKYYHLDPREWMG